MTFDWKVPYDALHASFRGSTKMPVIGITGNFGDKGCELAEGYYEAVRRAGAIPVVIPPTDDAEVLAGVLDRIDALVLSGGADMNPLFVGEEPEPGLHGINPRRDLCELLLIRLAYDRQLPMLGICRGIQMLASALGGRVWQDIYSHDVSNFNIEGHPLLKHSQDLVRGKASHGVILERESLLHHIFGAEYLAVNSFHHQAVREPGPCLRVAARAADGVIEGIESAEHKPIVGVQWHPECFCLEDDEVMQPLFEWLVSEASLFARAKAWHCRHLSLDSHEDTPMFFDQNIHFEQRDPRILVDLHKMTEGHLDASIMVAYLPQGECTSEGYDAAYEKADSLLTQIEEMVGQSAHAVELARTPADLYRIKASGKKAIMRGIENGYAIGEDLQRLEYFARRGIVYMTLCHNGNNAICGSARYNDLGLGVTAFGEQVIRRMNELGVVVDLSHAGERSFYDALDLSTQPVVCSHSSARALCDHPRNLTDEQLRSLARRGGVAQVTLYHGFLRKDGEASILDALDHLDHMIRVAGVDHVGIGTDFDGDGGVTGVASASELINFTRHLMRRRYSDEDLRLIWGANFLHVVETVQSQSAFELLNS